MRLLSKHAAAGWLLGLIVTAACGSPASSDADSSSMVGESAESSNSGWAGGGHLGVIRSALGAVTLRADQQATVGKLKAEAEARHFATREARLALRTAIAAQVENGKVDRTALAPHIASLQATVTGTRAADWAAFERLHAVLDGAQRSQFVDAIQTAMAARRGAHGHFRGTRMTEWASALGLRDSQISAIRGIVAEGRGESGVFAARRGGAREAGHAVLEAFRSDPLVVDEATKASFNHDSERLSKTLDVLEASLPILSVAQRNLAAQRLRSPDAEP